MRQDEGAWGTKKRQGEKEMQGEEKKKKRTERHTREKKVEI